jgi:hypothetical protein
MSLFYLHVEVPVLQYMTGLFMNFPIVKRARIENRFHIVGVQVKTTDKTLKHCPPNFLTYKDLFNRFN